MTEQDQFGFDYYSGKRVELGSGLSGTTYRGWANVKSTDADGNVVHERKPAALKEVRNAKDGANTLRREIMILYDIQSLGDPRLVKYLSVFFPPEIPIIATELVDGDTMGKAVGELPSGRLSGAALGRVLHWGVNLAAVLEGLSEREIVHKDIKPGNVMIRRNDLPVLLDFGIGSAKILQKVDGSISLEGFAGTPAFASPEQFCTAETPCPVCAGHDRTCPRGAPSDIYSLGATLWYALTRQTLFASETNKYMDFVRLGELKRGGVQKFDGVPDVPGLRPLLGHMLLGDPLARPKAAEVRERLTTIFAISSDSTPTQVYLPPPATSLATRRLQKLPTFVTLEYENNEDSGEVQIATTLLTLFVISYWSRQTAVRIDFDEFAALPAQMTHDQAVLTLRNLNSEPEILADVWEYHLPTSEQWSLAVGQAPENLGMVMPEFTNRLQDAGAIYEWSDDEGRPSPYPECHTVCYLERGAPNTCQRHRLWPKGGIRLLRRRRKDFSSKFRGVGGPNPSYHT